MSGEQMDQAGRGEFGGGDPTRWMSSLPWSARLAIYAKGVWSLLPRWSMFPLGMLGALGDAIHIESLSMEGRSPKAWMGFALGMAFCTLVIAVTVMIKEHVRQSCFGNSRHSWSKCSELALVSLIWAVLATVHAWKPDWEASSNAILALFTAAIYLNLFGDLIVEAATSWLSWAGETTRGVAVKISRARPASLASGLRRMFSGMGAALRSANRGTIEAGLSDPAQRAFYERRALREGLPNDSSAAERKVRL